MAAPILALREAGLSLGGKSLFNGIDLELYTGERICLVGRNGSGKSSLLKVLAGTLELDRGERALQPRLQLAFLPQEPVLPASGTIADAVLAGKTAGDEGLDIRHRADLVLEPLGLDGDASVIGLSGGERRRVSIARALISDPDIILLDEPTNHLDIQAIEWLEMELQQIRAAMIMISHDRSFLRALSRKTWWLDRGRLAVLHEGYGGFDAWSDQLLAEEEANLHRLDKKIQAEEHWLHRGVTGRRKRNMGRLRNLHALRQSRRDHLRQTGSVQLGQATTSRSGAMVIEAEHIAKGYGGRNLIGDFSTRIMRGDRVGIIGANGTGKTTLLNMLIGKLEPDSGRIRLGTELNISSFDQHRMALDMKTTPWQNLCPDGGDRIDVGGVSKHVVGYLRDFLFDESQARMPVRAMSGGERNRLLLAKILAAPGNLLVLDEPTNDLDMDTLDLLEDYLSDYSGTLLLVSHDRDFLDRLVTSTIVLEGDGQAREYAGGYSDYLRQRSEPAPSQVKAPPAGKEEGRSKAMANSQSQEERKRLGRAMRELERLPERMSALEDEIKALEKKLSEADFYTRDPSGFAAMTAKMDERRAALQDMEERWLELEELKAEMENAD